MNPAVSSVPVFEGYPCNIPFINMASECSVVKNIDEKFCQCPICLEQYKEPKLLPCLHRFCIECLRRLIQDAQGIGLLICPECREECEIPADGVDSFKTDFYMKNIVDFVILQTSLKDDQIRECFNCSKNTKVSAYCFKCSDCFCENCHNHHVTSRMMKDHRSHVLSLEELQSKNTSFAKLLSLKGVPRCQTHSENSLQLCCITCGNLPICVACSFGQHKDHAIIDVISQANTERDGLAENLGHLQECKGTLEKMTAKVGSLQEQIILNGSEEKRKLQSKYEDKVKEIELKRNKLREDSSAEKSKIEANTREKISFLQENMKKEIQDIKDKYDKLFEKERKETETSFNKVHEKLKNEESKIDAKLDYLKRESSYDIKLIENQEKKKLQINKEILQHFVNTTKRYDNLTSTAASIISAKHDWTAVNCIPDINSAINPVMKDANREFTELNEITNFEISGSSFVNFDIADTVTISDQPESVIYIGYGESNELEVIDITYSESGNIVVSGEIGKDESHITILSMDGTILKQKVVKSGPSFLRFCAALSNRKVVTAFTSGEIGLYDITTGLYVTTNIKGKVTSREEDIRLTGLDVDNSNNLIYVGCIAKKRSLIHTFDDHLNVCHSLKLPEEVSLSMDVTHCKGNLFVCAFNMNTVYRLDMEGNVLSKIQYMPGDKCTCAPFSVCTDKNGFIYTLWISNAPELVFEKDGIKAKTDDEVGDEDYEWTLVQYSQDGNHILAIKPFENGLSCMTIFERDHEEKLVLATLEPRKLFVFGLKQDANS